MMNVFGQIIRAFLFVLGAIMLVFGLWYQFAPRARYVDSAPTPNSVLSESPGNVTVNFNRELSAESKMNVLSIITMSPSGEEIHRAEKLHTVNGPLPNEASHSTLRVNVSPELSRGIYCVQWTVYPRYPGVRSHGMYYFGVGMSLPPYFTDTSPGGLHEQYWPRRRHRATLIGGVLLLLMAFFIPSRIWKLSR